MVDLVIQYTGSFDKPPEDLNGDMEHANIILREDGVDRVLFTGAQFDPDEFKRRMKARGR